MTLRDLFDWATRVPDHISPEHRRAYYVALIIGGSGGVFHFFMLVIFFIYGITPLVIFNVGSVSLFALIFFLVRRTGIAEFGMILGSVEMVMHQALAVYFLGWGFGYQYYLFVIAGFAFLGQYRSNAIPAISVLLSIAVFGWLYYQGQYLYEPHLGMPDSIRIGLYWWNLVCAGSGIATISFVYARTAERMERELAAQNQELREAQLMLVQSEKMAAIGKLAAGLTHEINTPIGAILSSSQTGKRAVERILESQDSDDSGKGGKPSRILGALQQSLESTVDAAQRLSEVVGRLRGFVRIDEAEVKSANLHEGIESALALLHNQVQDGAIEVHRHFDETLPEVLCRPADINQVLMHLLQNAIDAIDGHGSITITTSHEVDCVHVSIVDTGRGGTSEQCDGLFDFSFASGRSRVKLGMGLPISHQIVTRHQGSLRVESTPGKGSSFTITLPISMVGD